MSKELQLYLLPPVSSHQQKNSKNNFKKTGPLTHVFQTSDQGKRTPFVNHTEILKHTVSLTPLQKPIFLSGTKEIQKLGSKLWPCALNKHEVHDNLL